MEFFIQSFPQIIRRKNKCFLIRYSDAQGTEVYACVTVQSSDFGYAHSSSFQCSTFKYSAVQCRMFGVSLNLQNVSGGRGNLQGLPHMHSIGATLHYSTLHYITLHYTTLPWSLKPPQTPCHGVKTANWANLDKVSRFASGNRGKPSLRW